ncbi:MAG: hypothetical protein ABJP45_14805 [Cyclobacteriaceae bacterium]
MKLVKYCVPQGAHFFVLLSSCIALLLSLTSSAHAVVLSEYSLQYENKQWVLSFDQKTSQLRDAIYASRPDLKGMNLNSEVFMDATANHIISNLSITYGREQLDIVPQHMHYGGLRFESRFIVEGLSENPDNLNLSVDGFDAHEHSVVLFRVSIGKEGYLNYFNQNQHVATFDFATKSYTMEEVSSGGGGKRILYALLLLVLVGVAFRLFNTRRVNFR